MPLSFDPSIFKAYDIRGTVPEQLDAARADAFGRALATYFAESGGAGEVAVGRDMRTHSPEIAAALIDGLRALGCSVVDVGQCSTDGLYFAVGKYALRG